MVVIKYVSRFIVYIIYKMFLRSWFGKQQGLRNNNKVLVQINKGIGDSIHALPMIHALAAEGYEVHALVNKFTETTARLTPDIKKYYVLHECKLSNLLTRLSLISELNKLKFRYYIGALPSNLIRDIFLPVILGIPIRAIHSFYHKEKYRNYDFLYNARRKREPYTHNVNSNLQLLLENDIRFEIKQVKHNLILPASTIKVMKTRLSQMGYSPDKITIGIHPGCKGEWAYKKWPAKKYAGLISQLANQKNLQFILFGGPEEIELSEHIVQKTITTPLNLTGKLSLEETMCAISLCRIFIANDSGLMQIAAILGAAVIALFGRTEHIASAPWGTQHIVIQKDPIEDITVSEVYEEAIRLLGRINQTPELQE